MIPGQAPPPLPLDVWRKIALEDPRVCAKPAVTSRDMRDNLRDLTAIASKVTTEARADNGGSEAMRRAKAAKRDAFRVGRFFKVSDIPVVKELRDDFRAARTGEESAGAVMWMPHLALFPVLMPAKLVRRTVDALQARAEAQASIRRLSVQLPRGINQRIASSPGWRQACACMRGVQTGTGKV